MVELTKGFRKEDINFDADGNVMKDEEKAKKLSVREYRKGARKGTLFLFFRFEW
jgi:hypothetical protein